MKRDAIEIQAGFLGWAYIVNAPFRHFDNLGIASHDSSRTSQRRRTPAGVPRVWEALAGGILKIAGAAGRKTKALPLWPRAQLVCRFGRAMRPGANR